MARNLNKTLQKLTRPVIKQAGYGFLRRNPSNIVVFGGHMIDQQNRETPRFPAERVPLVSRQIEACLDDWAVNPGSLCVSSAACGGDLIFARAAMARNAKQIILLPRPVDAFVEHSVAYAGEEWIELFEHIKSGHKTTLAILPESVKQKYSGLKEYALINAWLASLSRAFPGVETRGLVLWNKQKGDKPGGTDDLVERLTEEGIGAEILHP